MDEIESLGEERTDPAAAAEASSGDETEPTAVSATSISTTYPLDDPDLLRPVYPYEAVLAEEELWKQVNALKRTADNFETRGLLAEHYTALAVLNARMGGADAAVRHIQKALEYRYDRTLSHWLARAWGLSGDLRFISAYQQLLSSVTSDIALVLEFCWFLEGRGLHSMALDLLAAHLRQIPTNVADSQQLDSYLSLLQSEGSLSSHAIIEQYLDLLVKYVPGATTQAMIIHRPEIQETIVGKEEEEVEPEVGLDDEVAEVSRLYSTGLEHYFFHTIFITAIAINFGASLLGVPAAYTRWVGTGIFVLAGSVIAVEAVRAFSRRGDSRQRSALFTKIALAAPLSLISTIAGSMLFHDSARFLHVAILPIFMFLMVAGAFGALGHQIRGLLRRILGLSAETKAIVVARVYSRGVAQLVAGSSKLALWVTGFWTMSTFAFATSTERSIVISKLLFFSLTWRWGTLSAKSEKQRERDHLLALLTALFLLRIIAQALSGSDILTIAQTFNWDAIILVGVFYSFLMQARQFSILFSIVAFLVFSVLHFMPLFLPRIFSPGRARAVVSAVMSTNVLVCALLSIIVIQNIFTKRPINFGDGEMRRRKPTGFEASVLVISALLLVTILALLLSGAKTLSSINLYLAVAGFVILVGA